MMRIPENRVHQVLTTVLTDRGFAPGRARTSARLFTEANRDGVFSHGLDRFERYLGGIASGLMDPAAEPSRSWGGGALERWDGHRGPGNLNARAAMGRAIELAGNYGMGGVALANTNHWMRAGSYGWQAVEAGCIGICWTNTMPNLPPWGADRPLVGNNPLVFAVPRESGAAVLDMAVSQFSYGALDRYARDGRPLPVPGGYDAEGELSTDARAILESGRPLPAGFWKGSGLSILLDLTAALLSGGRATCDIEADPDRETGISQVFLAFAPPEHPGLADRVLGILEENGVRYPGRRTLEHRAESAEKGIAVDEDVWNRITALL